MKYIFILNPISGTQKNPFNIIDMVNNVFDDSGHEYEFAFTTHAGEALDLSQKAVNEKYNVIVAAGGDGTLFDVINGYYKNSSKKKIPIGVLPVGTGNAFIRDIINDIILD